ncbi:expressed unknown protein [Ectocarpus siliculosus]|uniref:Uncharacterized protein n=1 Tax=Ectocarpus siliculosus TaxID=2880 RepID=D8LNH5_ECTSI|nr:expressed unknown protein [Ectocarpus siliculosus]|eukprot:CBN77332.1 expressed unknown protein [Ectocarpus siliculosus]
MWSITTAAVGESGRLSEWFDTSHVALPTGSRSAVKLIIMYIRVFDLFLVRSKSTAGAALCVPL